MIKLYRIISVLSISLAILSCHDEWIFSTDNRYELSFSADTVKMDTVFTGIASASAWFMVYNTNDVGLRFDAVMGGGADSPFRINLDGQGGSQITELEIPAGDSLFCFISVNIPQTGSPELFHAFDSIRFVLENGNIQCVRLSAYGQNAVILRGRRIESDTTLTAHLPYIVYDSLFVAPGAELRLAPGARLYFHSGAGLDVAGRLVAEGKPDSIILMRGDRLDLLLDELPYDLTAGTWQGVRLRSDSYDNVFSYCDIHGGDFGIKADSATDDRLKFSLHSSVVHNVSGTCLEATGCRIDVANSQISNAGESCVDIAGGESDFNFCTIASFSVWKMGVQAVLISAARNEKTVPFNRARFSNCIITGRHDDEFISIIPDSIKNIDSYSVSHSLVMTSDTLDRHFHKVLFDNHDNSTGGAANFRENSRIGYRSVYRLDSLSRARGIADSTSVDWPVDLAGVLRPPVGADAGCYQFVSTAK